MALTDMTPDTIRHLTDQEIANAVAALVANGVPFPIEQIRQSSTEDGHVASEFLIQPAFGQDRRYITVVVSTHG